MLGRVGGRGWTGWVAVVVVVGGCLALNLLVRLVQKAIRSRRNRNRPVG